MKARMQLEREANGGLRSAAGVKRVLAAEADRDRLVHPMFLVERSRRGRFDAA